MVDNYYAGHRFQWMEQFMKAVSKEQQLVRSTAYAIACCIHHQFIYRGRQKTFKLSHKTLALFGVDRRRIKPYLSSFQQANLIKYSIKIGKIPKITLLLIPTNTINKT